MNLKPDLTRKQLQQLLDKELLRQLLACTPLNLPRVFLFALLYTLMPGAVLGPTLGLLGTVVLAAVAAYLWLWSTPAALDSFLVFWLLWSCCSFVLSWCIQLAGGVLQFVRKRRYLAPAEATTADLKPGEAIDLPWTDAEAHEVVVQVAQRGVYVLMCRVEDSEASVQWQADERACLTEMECVPGLRSELRMAFRLEAGYHRLAWKVHCDEALQMRVFLH